MPLSLTFDSPFSSERQYSSSSDDSVAALFQPEAEPGESRSEYLESLFLKYRIEADKRFPEAAKSEFVALVVQEGIPYTIEFGPNLLRQLIRLYFIYGWDVIHKLETALRYASWTTAKPGFAVPYFVYTKKALAIAIRYCMAILESGAKTIAFANLTTFRDEMLRKQVKAYDFEDRKDMFSGTPYKTISNTLLAQELHKLVRESITLRERLKDLTARNQKARTYNDVINNFLALFTGPAWGPLAATRPVSFNPITIYDDEARELEVKLFESLRKLAKDHILALILFPGIDENYADPDLETALFKLQEQLDKQVTNVLQSLFTIDTPRQETAQSRITTGIYWEKEDELDIDSFPDIRDSVEKQVTEMFEKAEDFSLLSVSLLDELMNSGKIERDSFVYPVWYQYRDSLLKRSQEKQARQEAENAIWEQAGKLSALLSLTILVPGLGEITGPLALLIDLSILFHTACTINTAMDGMEFQVSKSLMMLDTKKPDFETALYNTGYVMNDLNNLKQGLVAQLGKEALLMLLGATTNKVLIRRALAWRSYALDIESLYL